MPIWKKKTFGLFVTILQTVTAQRREPDFGSDSDRFPLTGRMTTRPAGQSGGDNFGFDHDRSSGAIRRPVGTDDRDSFDSGAGRNTGFDRMTSAPDESGPLLRRTTERSRFNRVTASGASFSGSGSSSGDRFVDRNRDSDFGTTRNWREQVTENSRDRFRPESTGDRDQRPGDESSFVITSIDRKPGSGDGSSDRFTGTRDSNSFPLNYRIETEIQRVENKGSQLADGKSCDFMSACDTKVYALVDT